LFNKAAANFTGKRFEEVIGQTDAFLFAPEEARVVMAGDQAVLAAEKTTTYEEHVTDPAGNHLTFQSTKGPLFGENGTLLGLFGIARNITDLKRAEETLRRNERTLRESQIIAGLGSYVLNVHEGWWTSSDVMDQIFGIDQTYQRTVQGWGDLIHPDDRAIMLDYVNNEVLGKRSSFDKHYRIVRHHDQAERWVHGLGKLELDAQGRPLILYGTIQDITERHNMEVVLRRAQAAAEAASKAKDHFLAVLSHELRNPLNPVLATATMLHKDPRFDADTREQLAIICRNAELEAQLIDDLLDVTRIARGKIELACRPIELGTVLRGTIEVCRGDLETRRLEFVIDVSGGPYWISADPARLQQVFWNLLQLDFCRFFACP